MNRTKRFLFYFSLFVNGFFILTLEILGARFLSPFFGNTIFVWSSVISVTLASLACGYWIGGKLGDRPVSAQNTFYTLMGASGIVSLFIPLEIYFLLEKFTFLGYKFGPLYGATSIFFLPLLLLAAASTTAIKIKFEMRGLAASSAGFVFATSTVGSIAGALASGFLIIPTMSLDTAINTLSALIIMLAAIGLYIERTGQYKKLFILCVSLLVISAQPSRTNTDLFHKQGFYGDVRVIDRTTFGRCLLVDNIIQGCRDQETKSTPFHIFKDLLKPLDVRADDRQKEVLFLGLGAGISPQMITDQTYHKTIVELDPLVVEASKKYFGLEETNVQKIVVGDARTYLQTTNKKYDFIVIDLYRGASTDPFLWTREMFALVAGALQSDGIMSMNVPGTLNSTTDPFIQDVFATLSSVFPFVTAQSETPERLANIVVFASQSDKSALFEQKVPAHGGKIITDLRNPVDYNFATTAMELLLSSKMFIHKE